MQHKNTRTFFVPSLYQPIILICSVSKEQNEKSTQKLIMWSLPRERSESCLFTNEAPCVLRVDWSNHQEFSSLKLVFATRWQRNTIHVWKEEGAMGLRDFGYVPLTKPSPEIRHHFLRIFSTDTLKIKSSITMFCLSIAMQQNNSTQPTGIKG